MKKPVRKVGTWHTGQFRLGADTQCLTTVTLRGKAVRVAGIWTGTVTTTRARKSKVTQNSITWAALRGTGKKQFYNIHNSTEVRMRWGWVGERSRRAGVGEVRCSEVPKEQNQKQQGDQGDQDTGQGEASGFGKKK